MSLKGKDMSTKVNSYNVKDRETGELVQVVYASTLDEAKELAYNRYYWMEEHYIVTVSK